MSTVWLVISHVHYEGSRVVGVCKSLEKAKDVLKAEVNEEFGSYDEDQTRFEYIHGHTLYIVERVVIE